MVANGGIVPDRSVKAWMCASVVLALLAAFPLARAGDNERVVEDSALSQLDEAALIPVPGPSPACCLVRSEECLAPMARLTCRQLGGYSVRNCFFCAIMAAPDMEESVPPESLAVAPHDAGLGRASTLLVLLGKFVLP